MRDNIERLRDIQEAITEIEKYSTQGETIFRENELIQTWTFIIYKLLAKPLEVYLMILNLCIRTSTGEGLLILGMS